jgi:MtN3 and saliva related transmembrane protein
VAKGGTVVTLIGSIAGALTTACWLPQVVKTTKLGEADEFAWPYLVMLLVGLSAWIAYGILRSDVPIFLCNCVTLGFVVLMATVKVRGGRRRPRGVTVEAAVD